jgi:hypothetical protein
MNNDKKKKFSEFDDDDLVNDNVLFESNHKQGISEGT